MTLRQKMLLKELPKNNYNISKAAKKAGYKDSTSRSSFIYKNFRKIAQQVDYFSPEQIKKDIATTFRMAKKKKDLTNMNRNLEHRAKIAGMIVEKSQDVPVDKPDNQFSLNRLNSLKN